MEQRPVVIVEDRPLSRDELKYLLSHFHPDIKVVGEFSDIDTAWTLIESGTIEGVFLDIALDLAGGGDTDGLVLAQRINRLMPTPWIVFLTGRQEHALKAHEFRPYGYLLKPYNDAELARVLDKVRMDFPKASSVKSVLHQTADAPIRIEVSYKKYIKTEQGHISATRLTRFLTPDEIVYVYANDGIEVHLQAGELLKDVNITLAALEAMQLPCFERTHRNTLVNLKYVSGFRTDPQNEGSYLLQFKNQPVELPIGLTFFNRFKAAIKQCG